MSARTKIVHHLKNRYASTESLNREVDAILNEHAHELAEEQRAWARHKYGAAPTLALAEVVALDTADLIDPEVD